MASTTELVVVFPFVPVTATRLQSVRGMPQEIRRSDRQRLARFSNLNPHHTRRNRALSWLFARMATAPRLRAS